MAMRPSDFERDVKVEALHRSSAAIAAAVFADRAADIAML